MFFTKKYLLTILFLSISIFKQSHAVVILIHGSFAADSEWWKPEGNFFKNLEKEAEVLGHKVVPFCWAGTPTENCIKQSATVLVKLLLSYPSSEPLILIGHSHGGNVALFATKMLAEDFNKNSTSIDFLTNNLNDVKITNKIQKPFLIDTIYCLGTPIDEKKNLPPMDSIGSIVNLYSNGDMIQPCLGLKKRKIQSNKKIINLEIFVYQSTDKNKKFISPGHRELHTPSIGQWLLSIPQLLSQASVNLVNGIDGKLIFSNQQPPVFMIE